MPPTQLKLNFQNLKVGDLVVQHKKYASIYKTYGVVVDVDIESFDVVQIHWLNYGTFWTTCDKIVKVNKDEKI